MCQNIVEFLLLAEFTVWFTAGSNVFYLGSQVRGGSLSQGSFDITACQCLQGTDDGMILQSLLFLLSGSSVVAACVFLTTGCYFLLSVSRLHPIFATTFLRALFFYPDDFFHGQKIYN